MTDLEKLIVQNFAEEMTKKDNFLCEVIDNYNKLQEENARLKKILQELEDLSLKTYDVADFQMYFDNLRGKNDD